MTNEQTLYDRIRVKYQDAIETISRFNKTGRHPTGLYLLAEGIELILNNFDNLSGNELERIQVLDELAETFYHRSMERGWTRHNLAFEKLHELEKKEVDEKLKELDTKGITDENIRREEVDKINIKYFVDDREEAEELVQELEGRK